MAKHTIGRLPPRYSLLLNPYSDVRVSKCPRCQRPTHPRKFALLIHVEGWGPLALGKTCRYCTPCELVVVHRDELEAELAHTLGPIAPEAVGKDYFVVGTVDKKVWRQGLEGQKNLIGDVLGHAADFKKHYDLKVEGGWVRA